MDLYDWRLAIIESAVLFETWLNKFLRFVYNNNGLNKVQIENKFLNLRRNGSSIPKSIDDIAKNLVFDATGYDFKHSREYNGWRVHTKGMRNSIVHGKKYKVTQNQAQKAKS